MGSPFPLLLLATLLRSSTAADYTDSLATPSTTVTELLDVHNVARQAVGVPPLSWDRNLTNFAKKYAAKRRQDCRLLHSPGYDYGGNIFWGQGRRWRAAEVVAAWVDEKRWYHYNNNSCSSADCSHYTQIVWRTTEKLGCARIICKSGDTFVVCEYFPPGNYVGARPY